MKRLILLLVAGAACVAVAQSASFFSSTTTHSSGTTACSALNSRAGVSLDNAQGYTLVASANPDGGTQTFLSGSFNCCLYAPVYATADGRPVTWHWVDCPSSLNVSLTACANKADCTWGDFEPLTGVGRVAYVPSSVVVDGGTAANTTLTVRRRK